MPQDESGGMLRALLAQWPTYFAYVTYCLYIVVVLLNH